MDETLRNLAADASAYLKALHEHDVNGELADTLVRDWHTAKLGQMYGATVQPGRIISVESPAVSPADLADQVFRLRGGRA